MNVIANSPRHGLQCVAPCLQGIREWEVAPERYGFDVGGGHPGIIVGDDAVAPAFGRVRFHHQSDELDQACLPDGLTTNLHHIATWRRSAERNQSCGPGPKGVVDRHVGLVGIHSCQSKCVWEIRRYRRKLWKCGQWRVEVTGEDGALLFTVITVAVDAPKRGLVAHVDTANDKA